MAFLTKTRLNSREVLISKDLIDSNICHNEFVLVYVLKSYNSDKKNQKSKDLNSSLKILVYL